MTKHVRTFNPIKKKAVGRSGLSKLIGKKRKGFVPKIPPSASKAKRPPTKSRAGRIQKPTRLR